ncbi:MAG TPA: hypothetical protein VFQ53_38365 [Kofleriaceae bacterium]|nr:hypothetical protein [Kofleriaceae bacterium]
MGQGRRSLAMVAMLALASGCFGYNRSAKRWAYAGDTVMMVGGGSLIAADVLAGGSEAAPMNVPMTGAKPYDPPVSGVMVAGIVLVTAGLVGIVFNATRPDVKTSR